MDNRLILTVLFVTLSWISVGTYAQANMTTAEGNNTATNVATNMTTAAPNNTGTNVATNVATAAPNNTGTNVTTNVATAAPNNTGTNVATNVATAAPNNTGTNVATNVATAAPNNTGTNVATNVATAAPNNTGTNVATNVATAAPNNTGTNVTTNVATAAPNNTGTNVTTAAGNNTTAASTTTAPPLTPNTTVDVLETPISRSGCGTQQLCASQPSTCDPSGGSCFFVAAQRLSGDNFEFALAGQSEGYVAASLSNGSTLGHNDTTYVCANNKGLVTFFGTVLNNGKLIQKLLNVNSVKGKVNGKTIQCKFAATLPSADTRASSTFSLAISTGSFNSTSWTLGDPINQLQSLLVDLGNPNATVINQINTTTAPITVGTSNNHAITLQQSLTQALLITLGVLGLAML